MGFFEEHKALIITTLLCSILLLTMYNINISNSNEKVRETLIELNNMRQETPSEPEQAKEETPEKPTARQNLMTHQAFNQEKQETQSDMESRLDEIFQKNAALQTPAESDNSKSNAGEFNVGKTAAKKPQRASQGDQSTKELSSKKGNFRSSSIAFSLIGRTAIDIPNPVYTCDRTGKIVINITVNAEGLVTSTSYNKASSTSTNECLIDHAMEYARDAIFSKFSGRDSQPGTITYFFQG